MKDAPKNLSKRFMNAPFESYENVDENELKIDYNFQQLCNIILG